MSCILVRLFYKNILVCFKASGSKVVKHICCIAKRASVDITKRVTHICCFLLLTRFEFQHSISQLIFSYRPCPNWKCIFPYKWIYWWKHYLLGSHRGSWFLYALSVGCSTTDVYWLSETTTNRERKPGWKTVEIIGESIFWEEIQKFWGH